MMKKANVKNRFDLVDWWGTYSSNIEQIVVPKVESITSEQNAIDIPSTSLTAEETILLELLENGMSTEEIVSRTRSSKKRVANQLGSLFDKAGVNNRTELIRWWRAGGKGKAQTNS